MTRSAARSAEKAANGGYLHLISDLIALTLTVDGSVMVCVGGGGGARGVFDVSAEEVAAGGAAAEVGEVEVGEGGW